VEPSIVPAGKSKFCKIGTNLINFWLDLSEESSMIKYFIAKQPSAEQRVLYICTGFGLNRIYTQYTTVFLVISLPKMPHIHRIDIYDSGQPYILILGIIGVDAFFLVFKHSNGTSSMLIGSYNFWQAGQGFREGRAS
jgi:hypothetical protein